MSDIKVLMPRSVEGQLKLCNFTIEHLMLRFKQFHTEPDYLPENFPWAKDFVMGYPLPSFQRNSVWTVEDERAFIRSIFLGVDLGSYLVNSGIYERVKEWERVEDLPYADALIDGQQRLRSIEHFITDELEVFSSDGSLVTWSNISKKEQMRFKSIPFSANQCAEYKPSVLKEMYNNRAFGGVRHLPSEMA